MAWIAGAGRAGGAKAVAAGMVTGRDEAVASTGPVEAGCGAGVATTVTAEAAWAGPAERATIVVAAGPVSRWPGRAIGSGAEAMVTGDAAAGAAADA